jgi:glycosyltransferase involved in cell wall biosynthesis
VRIIFPGDPARGVKNFPLFQAVIQAYRHLYGDVDVVVLHQLSREQVREAMQSATALLMTSLSEGSPQVVKEALACDLAVVSSDVGDVRTLVGQAAGTAVYPLEAQAIDIAHLLHTCIVQSRVSVGARRARIEAAGMSHRQVARRLDDAYARVRLGMDSGLEC